MTSRGQLFPSICNINQNSELIVIDTKFGRVMGFVLGHFRADVLMHKQNKRKEPKTDK